MIGVDTQLTEKKIMKLTDLLKETHTQTPYTGQSRANPEMSRYPNNYSEEEGWVPITKLEDLLATWSNKHSSGYYIDEKNRADEYFMDVEDLIDFWKIMYQNEKEEKEGEGEERALDTPARSSLADLNENKVRKVIRKMIRE